MTNTVDGEVIRQAVVLDCEMGRSRASPNELLRVTMIDYITEEVLVDNIVVPRAPMVDYNTRYSGISQADVAIAYASGRAFDGNTCARNAVLRHIGPDTIVIGHALHNDFNALQWVHPTVVDTFMIERRFQVQPGGRRVNEAGACSLETLARVRLDRVIRAHGSHDSLEDCRATRDLAKWHVENNTRLI
jgi:DNA polymerase III epsilon subunit-like protein